MMATFVGVHRLNAGRDATLLILYHYFEVHAADAATGTTLL